MDLITFPGSKFADDHALMCFSHLRWDFVFQRPQHLMTRFAKRHDVLFIEEPVFDDGEPRFVVTPKLDRLKIAVPHLPHGTDITMIDSLMSGLLNRLITEQGITNFVSWYYTPMMLGWAEDLEPDAVVYDCMDELSAFKNAPAELRMKEAELFRRADMVFTGGRSLYESKHGQHESVYCFPSSIDVKHFARALSVQDEPADQADIPHPRIGFCGVIDERTNLDLLRQIADMRPDWQFVMLGPVVKIDENDLPKLENIHYLGAKKYDELPDYIGGWEVAMMPFAMNESTRFISPTKTPEYLAAGRPVVSTPIRDVVRPYGESGLVRIASTPDEFVDAINQALIDDLKEHRGRVTEFLETMSWDKTYDAMSALIDEAVARNAEGGTRNADSATSKELVNRVGMKS